MSEERAVEHTITADNASSDDFNQLSREQKKARLVTILERGVTSDRLRVNLPTHLYGEWVANDPMEIARLQGMGFELDTEYAPKRALHGSGTGEARVGDVVFMTTNRETKDLIDEIRREQFEAEHGKKAKNNNQREDREFKNGIANEVGEGVKTITESSQSVVNAQQLKDAISNKE